MDAVSELVPVVAAIVTGVLVVGVSLAGAFLANRSAKQRAEASAKEQRQARLHTDRITAYQQFRHAFVESQTASGQSSVFWAARVGATKRVKDENASADSVRHFDSVNASWLESIHVLTEKNRLLQLALGDLEIVASGQVRSAAIAMRRKATELRWANLEFTDTELEASVDKWASVNQKRQELEALEENLVAAIQTELSVDSPDGIGPV